MDEGEKTVHREKAEGAIQVIQMAVQAKELRERPGLMQLAPKWQWKEDAAMRRCSLT